MTRMGFQRYRRVTVNNIVHVSEVDAMNPGTVRHEYWEVDKYERHLKEPCCNRHSPFYVCYTYAVE